MRAEARLATYPDVITTLDRDGVPISVGEIREGMELFVLRIRQGRDPALVQRDRSVGLSGCEKALGINLTDYALARRSEADEAFVLRHHRARACAARAGGRKACCGSWRTCSRSAKTRTISWSTPRSARAARDWPSHDAHRRDAEDDGRGPDPDRAIGQADRPDPDPRQGAARDHGQLQHRRPMGEGRELLRAGEKEPDLLGRSHRRRLAIYRLAGRHSGHLRDLHADRRAPLRRRSRRRASCSPPGSAAWAARSRSPAPWPTPPSCASRSIATRIAKRMEIGYLDTQRQTLDAALAMIARRPAPRSRALSVGLCGNAADDLSRDRARAASCPTSSPTRPPRTIWSTAMSRPACRSIEVRALRKSDPQRLMAESTRSIAKHVGAMLAFQKSRRHRVRQRQSDPHPGQERAASRTPSTSRSSPRHSCGRCSRAPSARSAGSRSPAIPTISARSTTCCCVASRATRSSPTGCKLARDRIPFEGLPGAHRLARSWRAHRARPRGQPHGARGRALRAGRLHARPSRCRRDGASQHHDREHARRLGCHRRLAAAQCHGELRLPGRSRRDPFRRRRLCRLHDQRRGNARLPTGPMRADERLRLALTNDTSTGVMRYADAGYDESLDEIARGNINYLRLPSQ